MTDWWDYMDVNDWGMIILREKVEELGYDCLHAKLFAISGGELVELLSDSDTCPLANQVSKSRELEIWVVIPKSREVSNIGIDIEDHVNSIFYGSDEDYEEEVLENFDDNASLVNTPHVVGSDEIGVNEEHEAKTGEITVDVETVMNEEFAERNVEMIVINTQSDIAFDGDEELVQIPIQSNYEEVSVPMNRKTITKLPFIRRTKNGVKVAGVPKPRGVAMKKYHTRSTTSKSK